jgi:DNA-binding transcriptional regulator YiaG
MDKGVSQVELAKTIGVKEMTMVNWEVKGKVLKIKEVRERLAQEVDAVGRFF